MTEAADSYAARMEFMNCATEAAKGKDEKDEALEIREGLHNLLLITVQLMCKRIIFALG